MKNVLQVFRKAGKRLFFPILLLNAYTAYCQYLEQPVNNFNFALTANPVLMSHSSTPNLQASFSWHWIGLAVNSSYQAVSEAVPGFTKQHSEYAIIPSLKLFPFSAAFNRFYRSFGRQNSATPCFSFEEPREYTNLPNGPYLSAGYAIDKMRFTYLPDSSNHLPGGDLPIAVNNSGVALEAGYQITAKWLSVCFGYHVLMSIPKVESSYNPYGASIYTNTYPFNYRFQQGFHLQIGINLSF